MIETLGSRLRELRIMHNFTQEQIAELIGVNKMAVSYYENDTRQPPYSTLIHLSAIYNVSTDYLLGLEKQKTIKVSELWNSDITMIEKVVDVISKKNKNIIAYKERYGPISKESID